MSTHQHGPHERKRLSAACFCNADQVATAERAGQRLCLDGRGRLEASPRDGVDEFRVKAWPRRMKRFDVTRSPTTAADARSQRWPHSAHKYHTYTYAHRSNLEIQTETETERNRVTVTDRDRGRDTEANGGPETDRDPFAQT